MRNVASQVRHGLSAARRLVAVRRVLNECVPVSNCYGLNRGSSVDRFYIDRFLEENRSMIRGICLEILEDRYSSALGGTCAERVDVLDIDETNPRATMYGDLRHLERVANATYDCIILSQVLQYIDDVDSALRECHRVLKEGGTILATVPCLGRVDPSAGSDGDYWRFMPTGVRYLFEKTFASEQVDVSGLGNVVAGLGFWIGWAQEEMWMEELARNDEAFPCVVAVRAVK